MKENIGILHPGDMGVSIAASAKNSGHAVYWASAGRSPETRARAEKVGLLDAGSLSQMVATCPVIISVCPPDAAEEVAKSVLALGFTGLYLDANAIAPQRAERIAATLAAAGATYVDGSIIGGPAWKPNSTWLYLSGESAAKTAAFFEAGPLETRLLGTAISQASALKMCFAAYTKGTTALLAGILAAAEALDVRTALETQWAYDGSDFAEQTQQRVRRVTAKAWRFAGEMEEIAATLQGAGVPGDFHTAAAEVYRRMADFKDAAETPALEAVLAAILEG